LASLQNHIKGRAYDRVVLVTHSTGGLLASAYIALDNREAEVRKKVEKAVLIAAPLFGLYKTYQAIEAGEGLPIPATSGMKEWVKHVTHNSPTSYQLLPSQELLGHNLIQVYEDGEQTILNPLKYYDFLNSRKSFNSLLTNGGDKSHRHFRQEALQGDILKVLNRLGDRLTLIGSDYGHDTIYSVVYKGKNNSKFDVLVDKEGDGTIWWASSRGARRSFTDLPANYKNFRGMNHSDLRAEPEVLNFVNQTIAGEIPRSAAESNPAARRAEEDYGMSDRVKLHVISEKDVDVSIKDSSSEVVASITAGFPNGFNGETFSYFLTTADPDETDFVIYLPNTGYEVSFSSSENTDTPAGFTVEATTLGYDGFNTAKATYETSFTGASGEIMTLDLTSKTVTTQNLGTLEVSGKTVTPVVFYSQWELESAKTVGVGETAAITLSGADVTAGNVYESDLSWSSSDPDVVSVSSGGKVTGLKEGEAVIFAASQDDSYKFSRSVVTVTAGSNPDNPDNPNYPGDPDQNNPDSPAGPVASSGSGGGCDAGAAFAMSVLAALGALALRMGKKRG
jgi:pimeloyl-ACP methyl ester carboxylesterase